MSRIILLFLLPFLAVSGKHKSSSAFKFDPINNAFSMEYTPPNYKEKELPLCPNLNITAAWLSIIYRHCPPNEAYRNLGFPYDIKRLSRYPCGSGPAQWPGWNSSVQMVNASTFMEIIRVSRQYDWCLLANFYAPYCPFSARLAPWYNALPRVFPRLFVAAIDATEFSRLNNRYGIAGSPSLLLWHNGKAIARFDDVDYTLKSLEKFLTRWTDLEPFPDTDVSDDDMFGPVPTKPIVTRDYYLLLSYIFVVWCCVFYGLQTQTAAKCWESVRSYWREADLVENRRQE